MCYAKPLTLIYYFPLQVGQNSTSPLIWTQFFNGIAKLPKLYALKIIINNDGNAVYNHQLSTSCQKLRHLYVSGCSVISSDIVSDVLPQLKSLVVKTYINPECISASNSITEVVLPFSMLESVRHLHRLKKIRILPEEGPYNDLSRTLRVAGNVLRQITDLTVYAPHQRWQAILMCDLATVASYLERCRFVQLRGFKCFSPSDEFLSAFISNAPSVEKYHLRNCNVFHLQQIASMGRVKYVRAFLHPALKECSYVQEFLSGIEGNANNYITWHVSYCMPESLRGLI